MQSFLYTLYKDILKYQNQRLNQFWMFSEIIDSVWVLSSQGQRLPNRKTINHLVSELCCTSKKFDPFFVYFSPITDIAICLLLCTGVAVPVLVGYAWRHIVQKRLKCWNHRYQFCFFYCNWMMFSHNNIICQPRYQTLCNLDQQFVTFYDNSKENQIWDLKWTECIER